MTDIRATKQRLKLTLTGETVFCALLVVLWTYQTLGGFVTQIFRLLPVIGFTYPWILPFVTISLTILSIPYVLRHLRPGDILFYLAWMLTVLLTLFLPKNGPYVEEVLRLVLVSVLPMYFVGVAMPYERSKKLLFWASLIGVLATFAYQLYSLMSGRALAADGVSYNMSTAYKVLPSVMYLLYWAFDQKGIRYWLLAAVGIVLILLCGTRGPIVIVGVYSLLEVTLRIFRKRSWKRVVSLGAVVLVLLFLLVGDGISALATFLGEKVSEMGFSSRIFDYILLDKFATSDGRAYLSGNLIEAICARPIQGYGLMGDRIINNGSYAHNLALELWCQFGVFIGSFLLVGFLGVLLWSVWKSRKTDRGIFCRMLACLMVKLFLSSSYLLEPYLFLTLGFAMQTIRSRDGK